MLAVGVLGFPYIGALQGKKRFGAAALEEAKNLPGLVVNGAVSADALEDKDIYYGAIKYQSLESKKVDALLEDQSDDVKKAVADSRMAGKKLWPVWPFSRSSC